MALSLFRYHKLSHMENQRWLYLLGIVAVNFLLFQSILVPIGNAPWPSLQENYNPRDQFISFPLIQHSTTKHSTVRNPLPVNASISTKSNAFSGVKKNVHISTVQDKYESLKLGSVGPRKNLMPISAKESKMDFSVKQILETKSGISTVYQLVENKNTDLSEAERIDVHFQSPLSTNLTHSSPWKNNSVALDNGVATTIIPRGKKMRCEMPPKSRTLIQEMNRILVRRRAKSRAMV